ncbi:GDSL-type esterase/lipase family protein [Frigoriglobus tundricola]|uniref:TonB-like n=1 Tax=Frigoriglobus tundricola TaxID=2774151 RepID=A0A6M5YV16_9BACT|nr:GDSL-type esterase/lipase family protein [Frigoriglobus tundricola]QJW97779.1 TonB-like [Frigoriglobus tundricola]
MIVRRLVTASVVLALCLPACADEAKENPAAKPLNRDIDRHKKFLEIVEKGEGDVIFLGDSITHGWEGQKKIWDAAFGASKPVNLGIGGDQTGHVLWRITEGKEIDPLKPKLAVIMIGTNNMGAHTAEQIAGGVRTIVETLQKQKPDIKILVLGIFPRSPRAADAVRDKIKYANTFLAKLADGKQVFYKDIGDKFLEKDGSLDKKIMPDYLHLSAEGYQIWADAIKDDVAKLAK